MSVDHVILVKFVDMAMLTILYNLKQTFVSVDLPDDFYVTAFEYYDAIENNANTFCRDGDRLISLLERNGFWVNEPLPCRFKGKPGKKIAFEYCEIERARL